MIHTGALVLVFMLAIPSTLVESSPGFIRNDGQWPTEVSFLLREGDKDFWFTQEGVTVSLYLFPRSRAAGSVRTSTRNRLGSFSSRGSGCYPHPIPRCRSRSDDRGRGPSCDVPQLLSGEQSRSLAITRTPFQQDQVSGGLSRSRCALSSGGKRTEV